MTNTVSIIRSLIIYGLCLPLAVYLGYILAMPLDRVSLATIAVLLMLPLVPILLKWHHFLLIASWNMSVVLFFIPGSPTLCIILSAVSLLLSVIQHILVRNMKFVSVPSVIIPMLFITMVILFTAKLTGGIGLRSLGGEAVGGKRYFTVLGGIIGFFALTSHRIPQGKEITYVALFFLGSLTSLMGSFAPWFPSGMHFIFTLFPVENISALMDGEAQSSRLFLRLGGLAFGTAAVVHFILARHGIAGIVNLSEKWRFLPFKFSGGFAINQPWRVLCAVGVLFVSLTGGYRSVPILLGLMIFFQFWLEGLHRTRIAPAVVMVLCMIAGNLILFSDKLPYGVQRSLSFLPLKIDPLVKLDAENSSTWRVEIWREVLPTIPQYLVVGKGYSMDAREMEKINSVSQFSAAASQAGAELAGDYHNGPLSVIIPLGIFGVIGFLWFLIAGFRVLLKNYRYSEPRLKGINTFLLTYYIAKTIFFFFVFGSFYSELAVFGGFIALSISINGGMRQKETAPAEKQVTLPPFRFAKPARAV